MKFTKHDFWIFLQITALVVAIFASLAALVEYGIADYQQRAKERQLILEDARYYKTHPLVLNGCETDLECERLDEMLEVIHTSYTLD